MLRSSWVKSFFMAMMALYLWTATSYRHTLKRSHARHSFSPKPTGQRWKKMPLLSLAPSKKTFRKRPWMKTRRRSRATLCHPWRSTYLPVPPAGSSTNHGSLMAWRKGPERSTACTGKPGRAATATICQPFGITRSTRQRRWRRPRSATSMSMCWEN